MNFFYKIFPAIIAQCSFFSLQAEAQGIIAGDISYINTAPLTYQFKVTLYIEQSSPDSLLMTNWEDSISAIVYPTTTINAGTLCNINLKKNIYIFNHTYAGQGNLSLTVSFSNRTSGIANIPYSDTTAFTLRATMDLWIVSLANHSPTFAANPIDIADINSLFIHNPFAVDPEGDSLSYLAVPVLGAGGNPVPGYSLPPASSYFRIDSVTGDLIWNTPTAVGNYSVGYLIDEWRSGFFIGSVRRELFICVNAANDVLELPKIRNEFNIYPNPVINDLFLMRYPLSGKANMVIYNMLGERVYQSEIKNQKCAINVSHMPNGIYCIEVRNEKDVCRKKFIKKA